MKDLIFFKGWNFFFIILTAILFVPIVIIYPLTIIDKSNYFFLVIVPLSLIFVFAGYYFSLFKSRNLRILENGFNLLLFFDEKGFITFANYLALKFLRFQQEELLGQPLKKILIQKKQNYKGAFWGKTREIPLMSKNGKVVWVEGRIISLWGKKKQYALIAHDISQQKRVKKKLAENIHLLKGVMGVLADGLIIRNREWGIEMSNRQVDSFPKDVDHQIIEEEQHTEMPFPLQKGIDENGNNFFFLLTFNPVKDRENNLVKFIEYQNDVTTEYLLHNFFLHFHQMNEIHSMINHLAHELKNPLTVIKGYADLLRNKYPEDEWIKEILHETLLVNNMISSFMGTGRGRGENLHRVNFEQLLNETLQFLWEKGLIKGLTIQKQYLISGGYIEGNAVHFRLALIYLLNGIRQAIDGKQHKEVAIVMNKNAEGRELLCSFKVHELNPEKKEIMEMNISKAREILSLYHGELQVTTDHKEMTYQMILPVTQKAPSLV